jgi:amino acid transporter
MRSSIAPTVTAVFATCLFLSFALGGAVAFASDRLRPRLKALLAVLLLLVWISLGMSIAQIVARTASTLVTPGGARMPKLIESAGREALTLLASMGGPALLATLLGLLALKSRAPRKDAAADRTP